MKLFRIAAAAFIAAAAGVLVAPSTPASAHGAPIFPANRTYACYKDGKDHSNGGDLNPVNEACKAAIAKSGKNGLYNWFAQLISDGAGRTRDLLPDGKICSAGGKAPYDFSGFDLARADWPATNLTPGATVQFKYNKWAAHPGSFISYVTKSSYDPTKPLTWSQIEEKPFDSVSNPPSVGNAGSESAYYYWDAKLPSNVTGRHIIFTVWSRTDSKETFYTCSDVVFGGGGSGEPAPDPQPEPSEEPAPENPPASTGCSPMFAVSSAWNGGYQGEIMVHAGDTAVNNWKVSFTLPGVAQVWSGKGTKSGDTWTVNNESFNGSIPANGHVSFGFLGSGSPPMNIADLACTAS